MYDYGTRYHIPVGFISGSCDWVTPVDCMMDYYNAIQAPVKKVQLINGWGHNVPHENPEEFAHVLKSMLNELTF